MQTLSNSIKSFITKYMFVSGNVREYDFGTFCPLMCFEACIYKGNNLITVSWYSGIVYTKSSMFAVLSTDFGVYSLYCSSFNFERLNRDFDGTLKSIINFIEWFNSIDNVEFKTHSRIALDNGESFKVRNWESFKLLSITSLI